MGNSALDLESAWLGFNRMTITSSSVQDVAPKFRGVEISNFENPWEKAEAYCRSALDRDAAHAHAPKLLAAILLGKKDVAGAERALLQHLQNHPDDGASHHVLGQLAAHRGDHETAVAHFECAAKGLPTHAPIFNDLGVSLHRLGRREVAFSTLRRALELDPQFGVAHENVGIVFFDNNHFEAALQAHLVALTRTAPNLFEARASILKNLVNAAGRDGKLALAEKVLRIEVEHNFSVGAAEQLAIVLEYLRRPEDAKMVRNEVARRIGVQWAACAKQSKATILMIGAVGGNHIPTRYLIDQDAFSCLSITLLSQDQPDAAVVDIEALGRADVVFNTIGDADRDDGQLAAIAAVCERLGKPVLNPPGAIFKTGRDGAAQLFDGIEGMITPAARKASRTELIDLPLLQPMLVRPTGDHGGKHLELLHNDNEKQTYLSAHSQDHFVLTPFYDFQSTDDYWRKYRLIFVDRKVYPYHLAIGDKWLVHYWRAEMAQADWKRQEEETFLADWRHVFGDVAVSAIEEIARRLDLDYCGMDCALTKDGRVLLFEANACMLIHLDEPAAAFPYKHRYVPIIRDAFNRTVLKRAGTAANFDPTGDPKL
jgi:Tfp pilus assembly protein PilF